MRLVVPLVRAVSWGLIAASATVIAADRIQIETNGQYQPRSIVLIGSEGESIESGVNALVVSEASSRSLASIWFGAGSTASEIITSTGIPNSYDGEPGDELSLNAHETAWYAANLIAGKQTGFKITESSGNTKTQIGDVILKTGKKPATIESIKTTLAEGGKLEVLRNEEPKIIKLGPAKDHYTIKLDLWTEEKNPYHTPALTNVNGNSAGLALFIAYYQAITGEDIVPEGVSISVTGALRVLGNGQIEVTPIGKLDKKIRESTEAKMDYVLVPSEQQPMAAVYAEGQAKIIGAFSAQQVLYVLPFIGHEGEN